MIIKILVLSPCSYMCFCCCLFVFLGPHLQHMEVSRLGVKLELHLPGLHHSHSNTRSKLSLRTTPWLTAMPDPWPTEQGQGYNQHPHGYLSDPLPLHHDGNSCVCFLFWVVRWLINEYMKNRCFMNGQIMSFFYI